MMSKSIFAQVNFTTYDTCNRLNPLIGDWLYTNGTDTIKIYFRLHRGKYANGSKFVIDNLWGFLEYKQGNNIIVSDYDNRFINIPYLLDTFSYRSTVRIRFSECGANNSNLLTGRLRYRFLGDQIYNVNAILNSTGTQMTWHQVFVDTERQLLTTPTNQPQGSNAMPTDFVLIKQ